MWVFPLLLFMKTTSSRQHSSKLTEDRAEMEGMTLHQEGSRAWVKPPTPGTAGLMCGLEELGEPCTPRALVSGRESNKVTSAGPCHMWLCIRDRLRPAWSQRPTEEPLLLGQWLLPLPFKLHGCEQGIFPLSGPVSERLTSGRPSPRSEWSLSGEERATFLLRGSVCGRNTSPGEGVSVDPSVCHGVF